MLLNLAPECPQTSSLYNCVAVVEPHCINQIIKLMCFQSQQCRVWWLPSGCVGHTCANLFRPAASVFGEQGAQYFRIVKCNARRSACLKDPVMRCWRAHQMVDFALDSDPPQLYGRSCGGGFWGRVLHQAIHAARPKGPAYWCSPAQWTTLKGWGGRQQLYVQGFCV